MDYKMRVIAEKNELDERLAGLIAFIKSEAFIYLDGADAELLQTQKLIMGMLATCLSQRIARF